MLSEKAKPTDCGRSPEELGGGKENWKPLQNIKVLNERWKTSQISSCNDFLSLSYTQTTHTHTHTHTPSIAYNHIPERFFC